MAVQAPTADPLVRRARLVPAGLLVSATVGWAVVVWQSSTADGDMDAFTMGMQAPVFIAMWVAMMVAMMFPTAMPMVLTFARVHAAKQARGQPFVPTSLFVGAYLLLWTLFGVVAYAAAVGVDHLIARAMWPMESVARGGGVVLILAGLYQTTALKRTCLRRCRTPLQFLMTSWRDGYRGSFRMGVTHGAYCFGCCWALFVILFPLGIMNVAAMVAITAMIFAEKSLPRGQSIGRLAAVPLVTYGVLVLLRPGLLPTMTMTMT